MTDPDTATPTDIERDPAYLAAADWFLRLQGSAVSIEDTLAWQAWLNESPANARAFGRIEELSHVLRKVPLPPEVCERELKSDPYDASVPLKEWKEKSTLPWTTLALAALLAGVAFTLTVLLWQASPARMYVTAVGENHNITLSDGSTIALGGDTRISVTESPRVRAVELLKGEALFIVAKDPNRPFEVHVGDATIVALGTSFDIQRNSDRAIVSVTEGRVLVEPVAHFLPVSVLQQFRPKLRPVHLDAGQQTTAGSAGIEEPTEVTDPAAATSWQTGRLAFRLQPLRYVLEEVNRYAPKPIVLEQPDLGAISITGTVERNNISGWINSLERVFDVEADEQTDRIVIRSR
jgi:transmembrane sensor